MTDSHYYDHDDLARFGLVIEPFGHDAVVVREIPAILGSTDVRALVADVADGLACLTMADGDYPLYLAADSAALDPACAPDPDSWIPGSAYDLAIYGGELFDDALFSGLVSTPAELVVSAPDLDVFDLPVDTKAALDLTWEAGDDADARIVIRVWDQYGQGLVAAAADDGAFSIPAANLAAFSAGPGFITVARERAHTINFSAGQLRVLTRYERWGYVDLLD